MKKIALFSLLAATVLIVAPRPAHAGDKGWAILGGIVGGLIIADALDGDSNYHSSVSFGHRNGYWRDVSHNVWIDGRWVVSNRHHRYPTRHYVAGHYETRVRKVWVADFSRDRRVAHHDNRYERRHHHNRRHDTRRNDSRRHDTRRDDAHRNRDNDRSNRGDRKNRH